VHRAASQGAVPLLLLFVFVVPDEEIHFTAEFSDAKG
jgi:hypothetical protein